MSWATVQDTWVAYLNCSVLYDGTAVGALSRGDYLLIKKHDGSVSIHGGSLNQPRNYIRCTEVKTKEKSIIFINKKERLVVEVAKLHWMQPIRSWSESKVAIYKSERQLVEKFCKNIKTLLPEAYGGEVVLEYRIPGNGTVDIGIFKPNETWLIEVKRKRATQATTGQILKYRDHYSEEHQPNLLLVAPDISDNGLAYAESNNIRFIPLDWDPIPGDFERLLAKVGDVLSIFLSNLRHKQKDVSQ